jgi:hypothetical protein
MLTKRFPVLRSLINIASQRDGLPSMCAHLDLVQDIPVPVADLHFHHHNENKALDCLSYFCDPASSVQARPMAPRRLGVVSRLGTAMEVDGGDERVSGDGWNGENDHNAGEGEKGKEP